MGAYKDKERNTWYASFYYRDWNGENKKKTKRGFATKKEALEFENEFIMMRSSSVNIPLSVFFKMYEQDKKPRIKLNTWLTKENIVNTHILPYFGNIKVNEITPRDIVAWQNELLKMKDDVGNNYSKTYLRTINSQFSSLFNHAVRFYGLKDNPIHKAGSMGKKHADETNIWTREEFEKFIETQKSDSMAEVGFLILYWGGLRIGELLAVTKEDFDFENNSVTISKSYQRLQGEDYITDPKTEMSNRIVYLPQPVMDTIELYIESRHGYESNDRLFDKTKNYFSHRLKNGRIKAGVKQIRVHDLRHSHVSLLFEMGFSPVDIASRMGHENINITMRYAHMMPSKQQDMAVSMAKLFGDDEDV